MWPESWAILALGLLDLAVTLLLIQRGEAIESNPLLSIWLGFGVQWFLVAKAVLFCLIPVGLIEWLRTENPRKQGTLRIILRLGLAAYIVIYVVGSLGVNR